jgi:hypothetical protein
MNAPDTAALLAGPAPEPQTWATFTPGVFEAIPGDEYHAVEAMSASGAKKMLRSPQHYRLNRDQPGQPTDAMQFGTIVHCGVLEPDELDRRVCIAPKVDKRTTAGKLRWAEFVATAIGRIVVDQDDYDRARRCVDAVLAHPSASRLIEGAQRELSLFWLDGEYKVPCKARYDIHSHGGVSELKTTQDASPDGFAKQIANLNYHVQGAHYCSGREHVLNETPAFFAFIAVESEPPHVVACYTLPPVAIQAGRRLMDEALARYRDALAAGKWRGYPETIQAIDLPRWALRFDA